MPAEAEADIMVAPAEEARRRNSKSIITATGEGIITNPTDCQIRSINIDCCANNNNNNNNRGEAIPTVEADIRASSNKEYNKESMFQYIYKPLAYFK